MMNNDILYAWIYLPNEVSPILCGKIELLNGRRCIFSYASSWLEHEKAFPLAPDMPLHPGVLEPSFGLDVHSIFEDASPDRWGKNVINKVFNPGRRSPLEYLERAGNDRIGALGFSRSAEQFDVLDEQSFQVAELPELAQAAHALTIQAPINDELRRLLRPGASAGGARPKAIVQLDGEAWIAKFAMPDDHVNNCAIEHASLKLAQSCGVVVAESRLIEIGGRNALLVKRFDRENGGRLHFASSRTMLIAMGIPEDAMGYADIADLIRYISPEPKAACAELFRRMAINVLLDNSDDHAKNHVFLYRNGQWQLSPAYDIQPQLLGIGYQQLQIGRLGYEPTTENLLSDSGRFLLKRGDAESMLAEVVQQLSQWRDVFAKEGVSQNDIDACSAHVMNGRKFEFGKVPPRFIRPQPDGYYVGPAVAIDPEHVYQSIGRGNHVQHNREELQPLPMPNQFFQAQYNHEKVSLKIT